MEVDTSQMTHLWIFGEEMRGKINGPPSERLCNGKSLNFL